jgi:hypothetical protein
MAETLDNPGPVRGIVSGMVRRPSGQPVPRGHLEPVWITPPAGRVSEIGRLTSPDGTYRFGLPAATYTIKVYATASDGTSLYGEATEVIVTAGQETRADIVVAERRD